MPRVGFVPPVHGLNGSAQPLHGWRHVIGPPKVQHLVAHVAVPRIRFFGNVHNHEPLTVPFHQEGAHILDRVPIRCLEAGGRERHRDDSRRDVRQIQVVAVIVVAVFLLPPRQQSARSPGEQPGLLLVLAALVCGRLGVPLVFVRLQQSQEVGACRAGPAVGGPGLPFFIDLLLLILLAARFRVGVVQSRCLALCSFWSQSSSRFSSIKH
mmetsp:Transcript_25623/g.67188  ORF Transcript_25623/g.67188 Transcript_25623/m.67188 type:complete len:210 (-) Transcript_25623:72-701(-)